MDQTGRVIQLIATFLPIYGIVATVIAAVVLKRGWRLAALVLVPLVTLLLCSHFGAWIAYDGNMLYVLLAALYFEAVCVYYPVLFVVYGIRWLRRYRKAH